MRHSYKPGIGLPAGMLRRGEDPAVAAARELAEEVGVRVDPVSLRWVGRLRCTDEGKRDELEFFEAVLEPTPALAIDRREIVWAGFRRPDEILGAGAPPAVRRYFEELRGRPPADLSGPP